MSNFNPIFLDDLIDYVYGDKPKILLEFIKKSALTTKESKGDLWEKALDKAMDHTELLPANTPHMDFDDTSDAKFCTVTRYSGDGRFEATIGGISAKKGPLRVCICLDLPGTSKKKLYFLLIPYEFYSKRKGTNLKVYFKNYIPYGDIWNRFRCSWKEVISPIKV